MTGRTTFRAFRLAYDGRDYHGYQRQPAHATIEGRLLRGLEKLEVSTEEYAAAGRTDAGVSALAQTIVIESPPWLNAAALNGALPNDIVAWAQSDVDEAFHPRYDAVSREYVYIHYAPAVSLDAIRAAGDSLTGTHDFRNLTADQEDTVRTIDRIEFERVDPFVYITIRAPGFLRHQVRRIVSLLDLVGREELTSEDLEEILCGKPLPGHRGIPPADPRFLVLTDVEYPELTFEIDEQATVQAHERFRDASIDHVGLSRMLRTIANGIP